MVANERLEQAMTILSGKFDGKNIVLDKPAVNLAPGTEVQVLVPDKRISSLANIAALARPGNKPKDFAAQHEHYIKGTPKK